MIKVVNAKIETPIFLSSERPHLLIIENPHEYYAAVTEMQRAIDGELSEFTFWESIAQLQPAKTGEMLQNCFCFDFADKKIIGLLYKKLQSNYLSGDYIIGLNGINAKIAVFLQNLFDTVDFSLDYSEISLEDLLKACNVKPAKVYDSFLEKLICYINIFIELKSIRFFVFVGLKDILSDEDLLSLYNHCSLQKVELLLLESSKKRSLLSCERAIIITDDLCEIVENIKE